MPATDNPSPFWRFSLDFYRQPGVAEACLRLQDEAGIDVNLLLFLLWLAQSRRRLTEADVRIVDHRVAPWREQVVVPLRTIRRALKVPPAAFASAAVEGYRSKIKALELEAERLEQETLYILGESLGDAAPSPEAAARANIAAYQAISMQPFPTAAAEAVIAALGTRSEGR